MLSAERRREPFPNWFGLVWYLVGAPAIALLATWLLVQVEYGGGWFRTPLLAIFPLIAVVCLVPPALGGSGWLRFWFLQERPGRQFLAVTLPHAATRRPSPRSDDLAQASLILVLIPIVPLLPLVGAGLGALALLQRPRWVDGRRGRELAIAAIVVGLVGTIAQLAFCSSLALSML